MLTEPNGDPDHFPKVVRRPPVWGVVQGLFSFKEFHSEETLRKLAQALFQWSWKPFFGSWRFSVVDKPESQPTTFLNSEPLCEGVLHPLLSGLRKQPTFTTHLPKPTILSPSSWHHLPHCPVSPITLDLLKPKGYLKGIK